MNPEFSMSDQNLSRTIVLSDEITEESVQGIIGHIYRINDDEWRKSQILANWNPQPIKLVINTYGGSVHDGLALIGAMEMSRVPIHTIAVGSVFSMGVPIFVSGHYKIAHRYCTFMFHELSTFTAGKLEEHKMSVEEAERLQAMLDGIIVSNTEITKRKLEGIKKKRHDWYFSADEALDLGVADEIIQGPLIEDSDENHGHENI